MAHGFDAAPPQKGQPTVLVLNLTWGRAGMEHQILSFLRWARDVRDRLVYVGVEGSYPLAGAAELGFATGAIPRSRLREATVIRRLRRWIRDYDVALVHAHAPKAGVLAGLGAWGGPGPRVVTTIHNCHRAELRKGMVSPAAGLYSLAALWACRLLGQRFVAVSGAVRNDLLRQGIPEDRIVVVENGVDTDLLRRVPATSSLRLRLGLDANDRVVGTVGRLDKLKGQDVVLQALKRILVDHPHTRLLIVGSGPQDRRLRRLARELGIEGRVLFLGHRDDVPELLQIADIFIFSSLEEGFGLSLVEAMAAGRPVVATDIEAVREIVQHGVTGLLYRPRSPTALADAVQALLDDEGRRSGLGRAGAELVARRYSLARFGSRLLELYRREARL